MLIIFCLCLHLFIFQIATTKQYTIKRNMTIQQSFSYLTFSSSQKYIGATLNEKGCKLIILDGHTYKTLQQIQIKNKTVCPTIIQFSHDQQFLIVGDKNGVIYAFHKFQQQFFSNQPIDQIKLHNNQTKIITYNNQDTQVVVGGYSNKSYVIDTNYQFQKNKIYFLNKNQLNYTDWIFSFKFGPISGNLLVGGHGQDLLLIMDPKNNYSIITKLLNPLNAYSIDSVAFSQDQSLILVTGWTGDNSASVFLYDGKTYKPIDNLKDKISSYQYQKLHISDNNLYIAAIRQLTLVIWNRNNLQDKWNVFQSWTASYKYPTLMVKSGGIILWSLQNTSFYQSSICQSKQYYSSFNDSCLSCYNICGQCFGPLENQCTSCISRFFLNNTTCEKCMAGCLNCQDYQICNACDIDKHWIQSKNVCVCKDGWFKDNQNCLACNRQCSLCLRKDNCTACGVIPNTQLEQGKCVCSDHGQFINISTLSCERCNETVKYCIRCTGERLCILCDQALNRKLSQKGQCQCKDGYFQNKSANLCQSCEIQHCLKCNSLSNCTSCDRLNHWITDGHGNCVCEIRFLQIQNKCVKCNNQGCLICSPTVEKCTTCDTVRKWIYDQKMQTCNCPIGTFFDGNISCINCQLGCLLCKDQDKCSECYPQFKLINDTCECAKGKYKFNTTHCQTCLMGCQYCSNQNNCSQCYNDFRLNQQNNKCLCKDQKSYPNGQHCESCEQPCFTCQSKQKCLSCIQNYNYDQESNSCSKDSTLIVLIAIGLIVIATILIIICLIKAAMKIKKKKLDQQKLDQSLASLIIPRPGG